MAQFDTTGFDGIKKVFSNISNAADQFFPDIKLEDLFSKEFMQKHTKFSSADELFTSAGLNITCDEDIDAIEGEELARLDSLVKSSSCFGSWRELSEKAIEEHVDKLFED